MEQHDRDIEQMFEGLDENLQVEMWESLEQSTSDLELDPSMVQRIEQKTYAKLGINHTPLTEIVSRETSVLARPAFRWKPTAGGVARAVIVVGLLAVTSGPVSAALKKLVEFIPGIGTVQQSQGSSDVGVLIHPVQATWYGAPVTVMGVMVTPTQVLVRLNGTGMQAPRQVLFETVKGQIISLDSWNAVASAGENGAQWSGDYSVNGSFAAVGGALSGTVIIGPGTDTRIPVKLQVAKGVTDMSQLGPTESHQGISITAIAEPVGEKNVSLTFVPQYHGPFHIWNLVPPGASNEPGIQITDKSGKTYQATQTMSTGPNNLFSFQPAKGVSDYRVTVPQVDATYQGDARVTLPIPQQGSMAVDKTVNLGGFPIRFTKVELVNAQTIRLDLDLHANLSEAKALHLIDVGLSSEQKTDMKTGALQWLAVNIQPHQRFITLHLTRPEVYIRGPWKFNIHVPG